MHRGSLRSRIFETKRKDGTKVYRGPYALYTYKEKGKTISRRITNPEEQGRCREHIKAFRIATGHLTVRALRLGKKPRGRRRSSGGLSACHSTTPGRQARWQGHTMPHHHDNRAQNRLIDRHRIPGDFSSPGGVLRHGVVVAHWRSPYSGSRPGSHSTKGLTAESACARTRSRAKTGTSRFHNRFALTSPPNLDQ